MATQFQVKMQQHKNVNNVVSFKKLKKKRQTNCYVRYDYDHEIIILMRVMADKITEISRHVWIVFSSSSVVRLSAYNDEEFPVFVCPFKH